MTVCVLQSSVAWMGEYGEIKFIRFRQTCMSPTSCCYIDFAQQHWLLPAFSTLPLAASHVTFDRSIIWVTAAAFALCIFATTRIHKDENKINMSRKTALLMTLKGFSSSQKCH